MSFLFKFGSQLTLMCAGVSCLVCTGNLLAYGNNIYVKKTGENDSTKAEKHFAMIFACLMIWEMIGHTIFKTIS